MGNPTPTPTRTPTPNLNPSPSPSPTPTPTPTPNPYQVPLADLAGLADDLTDDRGADLADSTDLGAAELATAAAAAASGGARGGGGARESYPRAAGSPAGGPVSAALLAGVYPNARGEGIGRAHLFALRQLVATM